jgi:quinol-cytochrome oxidoreductase complex cytochrome b subunit
MTPCRKKKVDFSKILKKKTIKNRITKKQLDRKSHQKKNKKKLHFPEFFSFLFCWRVVFFLFFIALFLFFP